MKKIVGITGIVVSVLFGLYVGLYLCFIGGGVDIIQEIVHFAKNEAVSAMSIMWGVLKIMCSGVVGVFVFVTLFAPSMVLIGMKNAKVNLTIGRSKRKRQG